MAIEAQLPCDGDGVCMRCKVKPPTEECLMCVTCATPWHVHCLSSPPQSLASTAHWKCPDCSGDVNPVAGIVSSDGSGLVAAIHAIEADKSLTEAQKAKKRQQLMSGKSDDDVAASPLDEKFKCCICMDKLQKPVSTPCGHNTCLECFKKWVKEGKYTCVKCRNPFTKTVADNIRINLTLVSAIRLSNVPERASAAPSKIDHYVRNEDLPNEAYRTERAKKTGNANAASGKIFVTSPPDHFGPIPPVYDPARNRGVLVGDWWKDRQECRQWGAHFPHISGIAGQSKYGAQSVVLAAGYKDDVDHGDWILYTGSGGRDLSGNKRTNKEQSFHQTFENYNAALLMSCRMGYPVRVIRSFKKQNAYAPEKGVRYDGVYRVEKCWRTIGEQGVYKVCRYLFVRCDNEPAPWTSDDHGDLPRPLPEIPELEEATDLFERKQSPSWDFDEAEGLWKWVKPPPASRNIRKKSAKSNTKKTSKNSLKELRCRICQNVMTLPVTTPCAHTFCKTCLETRFAGISQVRERSRGGRTLRSKKVVMKCPCCTCDISDFLQNLQVNGELMDIIEKLAKKGEEPVEESEEKEGAETHDVVSEDEPPCKKMKLDT